MAWLEITVHTAGQDTEAVAAALTAGGFSDLVIEDQTQFEDFLEENRACWDYIDEELAAHLQGLAQVKLYLEDTDEAAMTRLEALAEKQGLQLTVEAMEETDWSESWKENYSPVEIGKNLVVLPCWLAESYEGHRLPVILDPGLTFGTGTHPSTQMVMAAMETLVRPGANCLDLGSGSGILSITALRLGAASASGVDIDPKAEDMARENAAFNGFGDPEFKAFTGDVTADRKLMSKLGEKDYDVVLVNIVADVIIHLAPVLPEFLTEKSVLILSGILDTRLQDVLAALQKAGLAPMEIFEKEDWRCVTAKRRYL